ncbi:RAD14/XpA-like DNA excision repair protein [Cryptosporidium canis]|uniref:RAD14/XpA-like DNA excision repair protein n=1 Tax=Cryptosporidium canis TaxID=195482 RepID=A0ABQ8P7B5_9CRYT|nr:RAD14/XpA-like DNA excision repair protein [Cryptosporidium canis]KAJ1610136.1 RAD14/XpA-like DNA excision repair protein [Cryptosporidium canis]
MSQACRSCGCEVGNNLSVAVEETLKGVGIYVCRRCFIQGKDDEYSMMTQTNAIRDYALSSEDLSGDGFAVLRKQASYGRNSFMKLYYKFQVEEAAARKHGSVEQALAESALAEDRRMQKRINKRLGIAGEVSEKEQRRREEKRARLEKRLETESKRKQLRQESIHTHEFDSPVRVDGGSGLFKKICRVCGFELTWEEI